MLLERLRDAAALETAIEDIEKELNRREIGCRLGGYLFFFERRNILM